MLLEGAQKVCVHYTYANHAVVGFEYEISHKLMFEHKPDGSIETIDNLGDRT